MDFIGIDMHETSSHVCILTEDGELIERRIKTDRESFDKMFAGTPPARILVESSTSGAVFLNVLEKKPPSIPLPAEPGPAAIKLHRRYRPRHPHLN